MAGYGLAHYEGVHVIGTLIGVDALYSGHVHHHAVVEQDAVATDHPDSGQIREQVERELPQSQHSAAGMTSRSTKARTLSRASLSSSERRLSMLMNSTGCVSRPVASGSIVVPAAFPSKPPLPKVS